jgi:hypothetical protein
METAYLNSPKRLNESSTLEQGAANEEIKKED